MGCQGRNSSDHCCYLDNKVCRYLEENSEPGYRWSCGLRRELGSWDAVLADPRYKPIGEFFAQWGMNCKTWGTEAHPCKQCGAGVSDADN